MIVFGRGRGLKWREHMSDVVYEYAEATLPHFAANAIHHRSGIHFLSANY